MQITILREGEKNLRCNVGILLIKRLIICSEALKSAITPSLSGRTVLIFSCVLPCIIFASSPIAITLLEVLSIATIEGLLTTPLSLCIIRVLAVPKSIAMSSVNKPIVDNILQN